LLSFERKLFAQNHPMMEFFEEHSQNFTALHEKLYGIALKFRPDPVTGAIHEINMTRGSMDPDVPKYSKN
jgi:hypothetical protein